jgi:hypothetical protein
MEDISIQHANLPDAGRTAHAQIDALLPSDGEKSKLQVIAAEAPVTVTGARDTPEEALANLLTALETLGMIIDGTTAS